MTLANVHCNVIKCDPDYIIIDGGDDPDIRVHTSHVYVYGSDKSETTHLVVMEERIAKEIGLDYIASN